MAGRDGGLVVPEDGGKAVWFLGHLMVFKALGEHTGGAYSLVDQTLAPAPVVGAPPHIHHGEDEAF